MGYNTKVIEIFETDEFVRWLDNLRDIKARARVMVRIERFAAGNKGDVKPVGEGVSEMRIDYGPGYRIYFKKGSRDVVVLLAGGDKRSQARDIKRAMRIGREM